MRRWKVTRRILLIAMAACLLCCTVAEAEKGGGGGGGGGGGNTETTPFSVIELPSFSRAHAVSNPDADGLVTVAGEGSEGGFISAAYALVDVASRRDHQRPAAGAHRQRPSRLGRQCSRYQYEPV